MNSIDNQQVQTFRLNFERLRDYPDKIIITDLTAFTEANIGIAHALAGVIIGRLISPTTNAPYKLPIFYLMDSIMKHVGGPFAAFFTKQLSEIYTVAFTGLHEKDRGKLSFLLDTWLERNLIPSDLIQKMKYQLNLNNQPINAVRQIAQKNNLPLPNNSIGNVPSSSFSTNIVLPFAANQSINQQASSVQVLQHNSVIFQDLVRNDMVAMLQQMYAEMGVANPLSLDQLAQVNPALWEQMLIKAEDNAYQLLSSRGITVTFNDSASLPHNLSHNLHPTDVVGSRKRPAVDSLSRVMPAQHSNERALTRQRDARSDDSFPNRSPLRENLGCREGNRSDHAQHAHDDFAGNNMSIDLMGGGVDDVQQQTAQEHLYVNGFLCETPVVLDVDRMHSLSAQMRTRYQDHAPAMSADFQAVARRVVQRLDSYVKDIFSPPHLPPLLFGPLPLELILQTSVMAGNAKAKQPTPPFRPEELGRNPESMLRDLYSNRPHQFHEDGLRFSTLAQLKQHTDEYLERKKLSQRRKEGGSVREYREWYCSRDQWVSDFNALTVATRDAGGSSAGSSGSGVGEQFIVPADEHFTRCPVSKEVFECFFDEEEGEMMFLNAVRVLVSEASQSAADTFKLGRPTEEPSVHYLIVHKLLVLDSWLETGQAVSLKNAVVRFEQSGNTDVVSKLRRAAGDDESEDDIFVRL